VLTEHIIDVREGQNSDGFDKYPYEEMKYQSLSVFFEEEKQSKFLICTKQSSCATHVTFKKPWVKKKLKLVDGQVAVLMLILTFFIACVVHFFNCKAPKPAY